MDQILASIIAWFARAFMDDALATFQMLTSWWIGDSYNLNLADENGAGGVLLFLRVHTNWLTASMAFAGFVIAAFRVAVQRKGEPLRAAFSQFFELAIIVLMIATVVHVASIAGDGYSSWILQVSAPKDDNWTEKWTDGLGSLQTGGTLFLFIIFGLFAMLSAIIQWGLMLFRSAAMVLLVGILPVLAASRFSSYGDYAYKRALGWLISWWAYGPVAATGAAAAQQLLQSDYQTDQYAGMALLIGMVFALPAVFSAIMPALREDNNSFGPRQVGHFLFGGTAVSVGRRTGIWSGMTDHLKSRRAQPAGAATAPGGRLAGVGAPGGGRPGGGAPGGRAPGGGTPGGGTPGGGTPGGGTTGTGRRTSTGAAASGATPSPSPTSGAVLGGGTGHGPRGAPPGGLNSGVGGPQVGGPSGAGTASGGTPGLSLPQSVPSYERDSYEPTPKFDSDFQRPSLKAAINQYKHPSGGSIAGGVDQFKPDTPTLRNALNDMRGPSGAD